MRASVGWSSRRCLGARTDKSKQRGTARRLCFGAFWPALASLALFSLPLPAVGDPATPAGMVPYDHPVFHNGRRVLWHGAWRAMGGKKGEAPAAAPIKGAPSAAANPPASPSSEYSILVDTDDPSAVRMAGELVAALRADGAQGRVVVGRTSPTALAKAVQNDGADLAIAPLDALIGDEETTADWRDRAPYIARLGAETVEIIAPRTIVDIRQLADRDVGYGVADGAAAATVATLFSRLDVAPNPSFAPLGPALADLAAGKLAAVVAVGGRTSKALADFGKDGRFHVVPIPWSPTLRAIYAPARLTARERPNLIGAEEKIDTLGAPMALIALDAAPSSPRAEQSAALARSFFEGFDKLLGPDNDATWREVNLASVASWPRLRAAQAWIDRNAMAPNASLDAFRAVAKMSTLANEGPGADDSDRLYDSLMRWRSAGQ